MKSVLVSITAFRKEYPLNDIRYNLPWYQSHPAYYGVQKAKDPLCYQGVISLQNVYENDSLWKGYYEIVLKRKLRSQVREEIGEKR